LFRLDGKVAILTGGSGTVGRAIAISLATAGASLVLNYKTNKQRNGLTKGDFLKVVSK
jgi:NAD(P)-dependent dehydrogenase (short-subunit alcohol dehydrogenase family)